MVPSMSPFDTKSFERDIPITDLYAFQSVAKTLFELFDLAQLSSLYQKLNFAFEEYKKTKHVPSWTRNITWLQFIDPENRLTIRQKRRIAYIWAPILGVDPQKVSASTILEVLLDIKESFGEKNMGLFVFNGPTQKVFLNPWKKYLESKGVRFQLDTKVFQIISRERKTH